MMNRRKFLQLSAIAPVATLSCKQQKEPVVTKPKRSQITTTRRDDLDYIERTDIKLAMAGYENRVVRMKVTAYCICKRCCGKWADGITASGHEITLHDRFVAADKRYPFGTQMCIPGYRRMKSYPDNCYPQRMKVLDRGGAIKGNHIDVYFDTHQEALEWGVQYLDVTVFMLNDRKE